MDAAKTVTARFDLIVNYTLTVRKTPVGQILGSVTSTPAGINCGLLCVTASASFPTGTVVTLTATADTGSTFTGWSGACSGSSTCDYARQYQVFVSDDGTTWGTPIATGRMVLNNAGRTAAECWLQIPSGGTSHL
jgi:hypothetical protein